ncbi:DUF411 domain-containing protein [Chenggangzhangella methanolivorans]|uniref:DUF411 domain-containing protein n=1 Tax=Chenggangzhangella methanolivorans TaxID=1437009 RepID=A0A9E6UKQ0_9HYPH|nr:DUF411 domain-containing protein [Chenggangzhangella methanolivorans]QZN99626.1 DUF411 domain-containing protein [Chenggangzhangella methanolivorans]
MTMDRRTFTLAAAGAALLLPGGVRAAPAMTVHKDPSCGCCGAWVDHVRAAGYETRVVETAAINAVKAKLGVPPGLRSCHTAEIDGYVLEGHVPAAAIGRLLAERPKVRGLAVPGMPIGSPGMEVEGRDRESYDVMAFGDGEPRAIMRFHGGVAL